MKNKRHLGHSALLNEVIRQVQFPVTVSVERNTCYYNILRKE